MPILQKTILAFLGRHETCSTEFVAEKIILQSANSILKFSQSFIALSVPTFDFTSAPFGALCYDLANGIGDTVTFGGGQAATFNASNGMVSIVAILGINSVSLESTCSPCASAATKRRPPWFQVIVGGNTLQFEQGWLYGCPFLRCEKAGLGWWLGNSTNRGKWIHRTALAASAT